MLCDVILEDDRWEAMDFPTLAETAAGATLGHLGLDPAPFEISVLACNDARIRDLNCAFREKDTPTNVLSWPSEERAAELDGDMPDLPEVGEDPELGDIAIAFETCIREAQEVGKKPQHHVTHLVVHGVLHILGYDHMRDKDATLMEGLEVAILGNLGVPNPYNGTDGALPDLER